jgi:hypothetical protein
VGKRQLYPIEHGIVKRQLRGDVDQRH